MADITAAADDAIIGDLEAELKMKREVRDDKYTWPVGEKRRKVGLRVAEGDRVRPPILQFSFHSPLVIVRINLPQRDLSKRMHSGAVAFCRVEQRTGHIE